MKIDVIGVNNATGVSGSIDIDECEKGEDNCDEDAQCDNTIGSFECTCNSGYEGPGDNCTGKFVFVLRMFNFYKVNNIANALYLLFRAHFNAPFSVTVITCTDANAMCTF